MRNDLFYSGKQAVKNWWVSLLIGVVAVALGIWCAVTPLTTLVALTIVFAVAFLVSGISEIVFAVSNQKVLKGWGWTLASGIIDLVFGFILISLPVEAIALVLTYFVGFWIMFQSIWAIGTSVELQRNNVRGWGWLLALAIAGVIMSIIFILSPVFTTGFIIWIISLSIIIYGIFRIYLGFKLRSLHKEMEELENDRRN